MIAWLTGLHVSGSTAALRFQSESGERISLVDSYFPYFYALCSGNHEEVAHIMQQHPKVISAHIEHKLASIRDSVPSPLVKITCSGIPDFDKVCKDMGKVPGVIELAETSLPHYLRYALDKGMRFFHLHEIEFAQGRLVRAVCKEEKGIPLFNCAALYNNSIIDSQGAKSDIRSLRDLCGFIQSNQVDCVFSWNAGIPKTMMADLGCIHIRIMDDISHDIYPDGIDQLSSAEAILSLGRKRLLRMIELCMMTGASPEDVLSVSPGRLNTYLHIKAARRRGHVIPEFKKEMERPKSLALLRAMDKGGIIFYPEPGIYVQVAKCDFASMYPSIIVSYNISPEMMDCSCNDFHEVPESGWRICKARQGVIPEGIRAVLERRLALKKLMKLEKDPALKEEYNLRQKALKNILVTCFGYLGFKNFIFSNVECKECVMLYGRHILTRTKEIAEQMGLEVIYGIVDSVFVKGGTEQEYQEFVNAVSKEIGITLEFDCIFRKIAFPCADDGSGVANKYYGIDPDKEIEARGIAIRHSDSPEFIKDFQGIVIPLLLSEEGLDAGLRIAESVRSEFEEKILRKKIPLESFAITKSVRKDPDDYSVNAAHVLAFRQMPNNEMVATFVYTTRGPRPLALASLQIVDCEKYIQLLNQSLAELVKGIKKEKEELKLGAYC